MESLFYISFDSPFNKITIIWKETDSNILVNHVFLSDPKLNSETKALNTYFQIKSKSSPLITSLEEKIQQFFIGAPIHFDIGILDFSGCSKIQEKVLMAEYQIPRGYISTYKRIATHIGIPNGARVVGNSLARNPFPILIPCHRAINTNGNLGGFQGGIEMKHKLLELEGIEFSNRGKVITNRIYY